jgi:hypothetical protein
MQMRFTRLGDGKRSGHEGPAAGASVRDMAIAQLLGLAQSAGFRFDVIDGRLVNVAPTADWAQWPLLRSCLDEIGVDAVIAYFERTSQDQRAALTAPAQ